MMGITGFVQEYYFFIFPPHFLPQYVKMFNK